MADIDHADAFGDAGGFRQQHRAAHDVEEVGNPLFRKTFGYDFRARKFRHLVQSPLARATARGW